MKVTVVPAWIRMRAGEYVYSLLLSPALTVKTLMDYARSGPNLSQPNPISMELLQGRYGHHHPDFQCEAARCHSLQAPNITISGRDTLRVE